MSEHKKREVLVRRKKKHNDVLLQIKAPNGCVSSTCLFSQKIKLSGKLFLILSSCINASIK